MAREFLCYNPQPSHQCNANTCVEGHALINFLGHHMHACMSRRINLPPHARTFHMSYPVYCTYIMFILQLAKVILNNQMQMHHQLSLILVQPLLLVRCRSILSSLVPKYQAKQDGMASKTLNYDVAMHRLETRWDVVRKHTKVVCLIFS